MRTITDHIVSGDQAVQLKIEVTDEPGAGERPATEVVEDEPTSGADEAADPAVHPECNLTGTRLISEQEDK